ncbi:MAG TPA: carboxypeptidase-like regulatory domain-containing protein [Pirellulales bacterium]|nr:carboxypeptidase-like regulatory domain-containing protein [Pirellulales bacterium]
MNAPRTFRGLIAQFLFAALVLAAFFLPALCLSVDVFNTAAVAADAGAPAPAPRADRPKEVPSSGKMRVTVVDADGRPIAGAKLSVSVWAEKDDLPHRGYDCDQQGQAEVQLPKSLSILRVWARAEGKVPLFAQWWPEHQADVERIPESFSFSMQEGDVIGGTVRDEAGQPIPGVKVEVMYEHKGLNVEMTKRPVFTRWLADGDEAQTTNGAGGWTLDNVPPGGDGNLRIKLTHPDYISDMNWGESQQNQNVALESLRSQSAVLVMRRGVEIAGRITDPDGKPVPRAVVIWGDNPYLEHRPRQEVLSDDEGRYQFPPLPPGKMAVTVVAEGWMPELRTVDIAPELGPVDFQLRPGKTLKVRFVLPGPGPLPEFAVQVAGWRDKQSLYNYDHPNVLPTAIPRRTQNSVYLWTWAPDDAVTFDVCPLKKELQLARTTLKLAPTDREQVVVLSLPLHVAGRVTDAATGRPVATFTVVPVQDWGQECRVERNGAREFSGGQYTWDFGINGAGAMVGRRLRIEAEGYRTAMSPLWSSGQANAVGDFALEPATATVGRVFTADHKPAAGAKVVLATPSQWAVIHGGDVAQDRENLHATTDRFGAFSFPAQFEPYTVIATHDSGYAEVTRAADSMAGELILAPWGRIEGRLQYPADVADRTNVWFAMLRPHGPGIPKVEDARRAKSSAADQYSFDRVPPGRGVLGADRLNTKVLVSTEFFPVDVPAGESIPHDFGAGAQVRGSLVLVGDTTDDVQLDHARVSLVRKGAVVAPPPGIDAERFAASDGWNDAWDDGSEGSAYLAALHHFNFRPTKAGALRIDGVPAGDYTLAIRLSHVREGQQPLPARTHLMQITVTEADAAQRKTIDLGAIKVDTAPRAEEAAQPAADE